MFILADLYEKLEVIALDVVELGGEDEAGAGAELAVGLVDNVAQDKLLKIQVRLEIEIQQLTDRNSTVNHCWILI